MKNRRTPERKRPPRCKKGGGCSVDSSLPKHCPGCRQRPKNPVSASALLTGKFLRVWMVSFLSRRFLFCPDGFNLVRMVSILSEWFLICPNGFYSVRTVSILSGRFQFCPDGFNTVRTVSILSGWFQFCPDGVK